MKDSMELDEYLEALWYMKEDGKDSMAELEAEIGANFNIQIVNECLAGGLASVSDDDNTVALTIKGEERARRIIRAHRLAERLLFDVMGMTKNIEEGACEFEHMVTPALVDSICTMLGHPKESPQGLPIPPGECCDSAATTIESSVIHLTEMEIGQAARVAYVNCRKDHELHRLNGLQIRPGVNIKLHQTYPSFVIECEGSNIALDEEIANNICVWREKKYMPKTSRTDAAKKHTLFRRGMGIFKKHRKSE
ncbi:metal-dependent transcriptional regulator [Candidatus Magnetominusculus dajiuhuensis]|uniref:metal-dependent transcriptional regulator n=1 Tax=Candidatus Magnetominusculus dajiuhuensis TaxID=3137712 RepID=UPI003B43744F